MHTDWQGGVRVNTFASGQRTDSEGHFNIADWYTILSICVLAGVIPIDKHAEKANIPLIDSLNMWRPLISGEI